MKALEKINIAAPFVFAAVESITLIEPSIWRANADIRFYMDIWYSIWVVSVGMQYAPKWAIAFLTWSLLPPLLGVYEGARYENASDAFLRLDALICVGFLLYEIAIIEVAHHHFEKVFGWLLPSKYEVVERIGVSWMIRCYKELYRQMARWWKVGGNHGLMILCALSFAKFFGNSGQKRGNLLLHEIETSEVSVRIADNGDIVLSASKRTLDVATIAIRKAEEGGLSAAVEFLHSHAEV